MMMLSRSVRRANFNSHCNVSKRLKQTRSQMTPPRNCWSKRLIKLTRKKRCRSVVVRRRISTSSVVSTTNYFLNVQIAGYSYLCNIEYVILNKRSSASLALLGPCSQGSAFSFLVWENCKGHWSFRHVYLHNYLALPIKGWSFVLSYDHVCRVLRSSSSWRRRGLGGGTENVGVWRGSCRHQRRR